MRDWDAILCRSFCAKADRRWWRGCAATSSTTMRRPAGRGRHLSRGEGVPQEAGEERRVPGETAGKDARTAALLARGRDDARAGEDGGVRPRQGTPGGRARGRAAVRRRRPHDGGIGDLALGETPESRARAVAIHFQGWALSTLCRTGYDADARIERGFRFLLANRQADGGWAWRGVRTDSAARPSSHLITGMALRAFAASPTPGPRARPAAPPSCSRPASCSPIATPIARRPATGNSSASRASSPTCSTRSIASPPSASARRIRACGPPKPTCAAARTSTGSGTGRAAAHRARRQAAAAQRQGSRARALADRTRADRLAARQLSRSCSAGRCTVVAA